MRKHYSRSTAPPLRRALALFATLFIATVLLLNSSTVYAQDGNPDPFACYAIGDEYLSADTLDPVGALDPAGNEAAFDYLAVIDRDTGFATPIGPTNTGSIEAMAFVPNPAGPIFNELFAVANESPNQLLIADTLGKVDLTNGSWSPINAGTTIGSGDGADGTFTFNDIDGLTYDVQRGILWAIQRNSATGASDYLLQLNPATGQIVENAFGTGVDYAVVEVATDPTFETPAGDPYDDVDDLAVDPVTGRMFIIMNKGGRGGGIVELNPVDGSVIEYIGLFTTTTSPDGFADDMEGLAFFNDGQLYGSSGNNGPPEAGANPDADDDLLYVIDVATGAASLVGAFPDGVQDIEGLGCLTAPAFITLEKATNGEDADTPTGPSITLGEPVTWTYEIENTGAVPLLNMSLSDDIELAIGDTTNSRCLEGPFPASFGVGATFTCTVVGTATTNGQYANIGRVNAVYQAPSPNGGTEDIPVSSIDPSHYFGQLNPLPGIQIIKTAGDAADGAVYTAPAPGDVTFTYVVSNTGNTHLIDITITDDAGTPGAANSADDVTLDSTTCGGLAGPLSPGDSVTCTVDIQVDADATNIAETTGTPTDETGVPYDTDKPIDDDPADVVVTPLVPNIDIIKTAGDAADGDVYTITEMGPVTFTYLISNTGETHLSDITIVDDAGTSTEIADDVTIDSTNCPELSGPLAPGDSITCMTMIQVNGDAINVAVTRGNPTDEDGNDLPNIEDPTANDPAEVDFVPGIPGIQIIKTAGTAGDGAVYSIGSAGPVIFTYVVSNIGETHLTNITITDDAGTPGAANSADDVTIDSSTCAELVGPVAPSDSVTCTQEIQVNSDAVNIAETTGTPTNETGTPLPQTEPPTDTDDAEVILLGTIGDRVWLDANSDGQQDIGENGLADVTVILTMPDGSVLTDTTDSDGMYLFTDLPAGNYVVTVDTNTLPLTVAQTYDADGLATPNESSLTLGAGEENLLQDFGYVPAGPGIAIVKTAGDADDGDVFTIEAPDIVAYRYVVTNIGNTYLTDITIVDDLGTPADLTDDLQINSSLCAGLAGPVAPQAFVVCTADVTVNQDVVNVAVTTGIPTDEDGDPIPGIEQPTAEDDAEVVYNPPGPDISIIKRAGDAADGDDYIINAPEEVTFTFVIENTGDTYLTDITITDDAGTAADASDDTTLTSSVCPELAGPLAPGGTVTCTLALSINGDTVNNAATTGTPSMSDGTPFPGVERPIDEDPATVILQAGPGIQLLKTVYEGHNNGANCPGTEVVEAAVDTPITYCFEVRNTGTTYLSDIVVNDPDLGISLQGPALLAPGDNVTLFYETTLVSALLNTANTTGTPSDETGVPIPGVEKPTDDDTAEVRPLATIGDIVWYDVNANGIQDADEAGIAGVIITLYDESGTVLDTQVSDDEGGYGFIVTPGAYSVGFSVADLNGYYLSPKDAIIDDEMDSDADPQNAGRTVETSLVVGESDLSWDAGVYAPPVLEIQKDDGEAVIQPSGTVIYSIVYSNTGVSDATGVVITERVPQYTSFAPELSTPGWQCLEAPNSDTAICTFEIGRVEKGTSGRLTLTFVVFVDRFIPENVASINNTVTISDDGQRGVPPDSQFSNELITPIFRPTDLELIPEPGLPESASIHLYLPTVINR